MIRGLLGEKFTFLRCICSKLINKELIEKADLFDNNFHLKLSGFLIKNQFLMENSLVA